MSYTVTLETTFNDKQLKGLANSYYEMLSNEVYLIKKQVRSCAWIDLPREIIPYIEKEIITVIQLEKLKYYILPFDLMINNPVYDYIQIFLYKWNWQKQLFVEYINKRNTITGDFIFGKLLGYSDISMNDFFRRNKIKDII